MDDINKLLEIDIAQFLVTLVIIMGAFIAGKRMIEEISQAINKPVKWLKSKNKDHEKLEQLQESLTSHYSENRYEFEKLKQADDDMKQSLTDLDSKLDKLGDMFLTKQISDMRCYLIDTASAIAGGRKYTLEQITYSLKLYDEYDKLLEANGLTNGQVSISIEIIRKEYLDMMSNAS